MLNIRNIDTWNGKNTLEDLDAMGINPLLDLTEHIDSMMDEDTPESHGKIFTLNRMIDFGLREFQASLGRMWLNFPKNIKPAA